MFGVISTFSTRDLSLPKNSEYSPLAFVSEDSAHYTKFRTLLFNKRILVFSLNSYSLPAVNGRYISYFPVELT